MHYQTTNQDFMEYFHHERRILSGEFSRNIEGKFVGMQAPTPYNRPGIEAIYNELIKIRESL